MSIVASILEKLNIDFKEPKNGSEILIHCPIPDHKDRTPSCYVNETSGKWFCFGCARGGPIEYLVQLVSGEKIEIDELISVEDQIKLKIKRVYKTSAENILCYDDQKDFELFYKTESKNFIPALDNETASKYLITERKFSSKTIRKFHLMYAIGGAYENRVIIPYFKNGSLIGFNSRLIGVDKEHGKKNRYRYAINSKEMEDFIYNFENVKDRSYCIIVEGPFDLMYMEQNGFNNVITTLTTRLSFKHIIKIIEFKKFIFGFDNDIESKAGDNARLKAANKIFSVDPTKQIFCADFPPGKDPNKCTPEELKESFSKLKRVILK